MVLVVSKKYAFAPAWVNSERVVLAEHQYIENYRHYSIVAPENCILGNIKNLLPHSTKMFQGKRTESFKQSV